MGERKPLPCIVCGFQPEPVGASEGYQPYGATMFDAGAGHYGSTVWDEMSPYRTLTINVCDTCLTVRSSRVAVAVTTPQPHPEVEFQPWGVDDREAGDVPC